MITSSGRSTLVIGLLGLGWTAPRAPRSLAALTGADLPAAVLALLELVLLVLAGWVVLSLAVGCLRGAPGRLGRALLPRAVRAVLFVGVAGTLVAAPAHASGPEQWPLDGLRLPERVTSEPLRPTADSSSPAQPSPAAATSVTVRPGDSLWSIAAEQLREPSEAEVAALVGRLHRLNADTVGPDPDLVLPGQHLVLPEDLS